MGEDECWHRIARWPPDTGAFAQCVASPLAQARHGKERHEAQSLIHRENPIRTHIRTMITKRIVTGWPDQLTDPDTPFVTRNLRDLADLLPFV